MKGVVPIVNSVRREPLESRSSVFGVEELPELSRTQILRSYHVCRWNARVRPYESWHPDLVAAVLQVSRGLDAPDTFDRSARCSI